MTAPDPREFDALLHSGQEALAKNAWPEARAAFAKAVDSAKDDPVAWEGLGMSAWWLEDYAAAMSAREQAFRLYQEAQDRRGMARMAFYLALDSLDFRGEPAVAAGWLGRGRRILSGQPPSPELAMILLLEGNQVLMGDNDTARARALAREAMDIARAVGPPDAEVLGIAMEGLALVSEGEIKGGMQLLDEATVTALAGGLTDLNLIGTTCCYLIHACERVRDLDRATQWCERMQAFCREHNFTSMFTVCRTQYATVLMLRGLWSEAERELEAATDELRAARPASIASGLIRLAELRRRQGRLEEAAELFQQAPSHRLALLGRAELALERGNPGEAGEIVAQYLRRFPKETRTERVVGLDLALRVACETGKTEAAEEALREIRETAAVVGTAPLRATALNAEGLVAARAGLLEQARVCLEDGALLFEESGIPYEAAMALLTLSLVNRKLRRKTEAIESGTRASALATRLGAGRLLDQAATRIREAEAPDNERPGADSPAKSRPASPPSPSAASDLPLTARELEVLKLVARGLGDKDIAAKLHLSPHTVHRHISNVLTKLDLPTRAAAVAYASRAGLL